MNGMEKRLKRLEGTQTDSGGTPEWCMDRASDEARLGFIDLSELDARAGAIAGQYRGDGTYLEHQQQKHHDFVVMGA